MLLISALIVVLSLLLEVRPGEHVGLRGAVGPDLPGTCTPRQVLGIPCPGCGLTRSLICLARGDLDGSWQAHRLGWLVALAVLLQFPYRIAILWTGSEPLGRLVPRLFGHGLVAVLVLNWLVLALVR